MKDWKQRQVFTPRMSPQSVNDSCNGSQLPCELLVSPMLSDGLNERGSVAFGIGETNCSQGSSQQFLAYLQHHTLNMKYTHMHDCK